MVGLGGGHHGSTRFSDNVITQNVAGAGMGAGITVAFGNRTGAAGGNDLSDEALRALVERAEALAKSTEPDTEYMPPLEPQEYLDVPDYAARTAEFGPPDRGAIVREVVGAASAASLRAAGSVASGVGSGLTANSRGLVAFHESTSANLIVSMLGDGCSGWAGWRGHEVAGLDPQQVAASARHYAELARDPVEVPPGHYTVILLPEPLSELVFYMLWHTDAKAADEGRSAFRDREGTRIVGENITLRTDPTCPAVPGSPHFGDGLPTRPRTIVDRGVLTSLNYTRFWAQKKGHEPCYMPTNVLMDGGEASLEELIASVEDGLLINRLWYIRDVDKMKLLLTGMTRDALLRIKDGQIVGAAKHMRFNMSPLDMLSRVRALGRPDPAASFNALLPPIVVEDFYFSSGTQF
jgi:predicted Zn-dependent protease